ncbi:MarR family transcriptional regulator [Nocardia sp. NBC_01327]|uniref:MarR family transcriptional regulator n=1 Tax=Nocardia sp. NBC_01327 TaxID=2903593 RepID=UPI002E0D5259|nr:MarR family transcriptional regulator [Nocardia sp. NBC_01327]
MDAASLHLIARRLRTIAFTATGTTGSRRFAPSEFAVIEDVALHPESSIREITDRTAIVQSLVSRIVARYRDDGLLRTEPDPSDGRRVRVSVDPVMLVEVLRKRGRKPIEAALAAELPRLLPAQRHRVSELLDELAELLRADGPDSHTDS